MGGVTLREHQVADTVAQLIKEQCLNVRWKDSYALMGRFDVVDIVEAAKPSEVEMAVMNARRRACLLLLQLRVALNEHPIGWLGGYVASYTADAVICCRVFLRILRLE